MSPIGHLPNFIGIGAQKCASTWLYDVLRDHPEVTLSTTKELDFFSCHYDRGLNWYRQRFPVRAGGRVRGEISPSYFHDPQVPARVQAHLPGVRIIVALRDPVERALSHHRHALRLGDLALPPPSGSGGLRGPGAGPGTGLGAGSAGGLLSFEQALAANPMYLEQGRYATHLRRWQAHHSADHLLVLFTEDIQAAPQAVVRRLYRFLDIAEQHRPPALRQASNASHVLASPRLERWRQGLNRGAGRLGLGGLWEGLAQAGARRLYHRLNRRPVSGRMAPPRPETLQHLRQHFAPEVRELARLTGRNLDHWLPAATPDAGATRP